MDIRLGLVAILVASPLAVGTMGCGLRSDPLIPDTLLSDDGGSSDDGAVDPDRAGSCNDPFSIPFTDTRVTGSLASGGSLSEGWCGSDGGPEDQYTLVVDFNTDVTIDVDASATDFDPVLRVEQGGCGGTGETLVCDRGISDAPHHFLAIAGVQYTITIDSKEGQDGDYAFDVRFGAPPIAQCDPHPEFIEQVSGATFVWENHFSKGQGRVDGYCGGPGRENMFPLNTYYPGFMFVNVTGSGGLSPAVSVRTACGGTSEVSCAANGDTGVVGVAELELFIPGPGLYYVVVDQTTIDGGDYALRVDFE